MELEREDVDDILRILDSTPYNALSVSTERFSLRLQRTAEAGWQGEIDTRVQANIIELPDSLVAADAVATSSAGVEVAGMMRVNAPLPGTFYRAPRPGADPFVNEGDRVEADTVVCIVETMKLMNSVKAGHSGTVSRILVANGDMVEQGAALVLIDTGAA